MSTWTIIEEEAHEILDIGGIVSDPTDPVPTFKSGDSPETTGDTEVPDEVWSAGYVPPSPYIRNTNRNLQFNEQIFIASPGYPDGVTSYLMTDDGYTWGRMSLAINAMWPFNSADYEDASTPLAQVNAYYAGNFVTTPPPGVVKVTANYKAQDMKFWSNQDGAAPGADDAVALDRYIITDEWGNKYVMHASGQVDQSDVRSAFDAAVLPDGWTKTVVQLRNDLILKPAKGSDGSYHYLVFRDSADNTYHQFQWSGKGSLASQLDGMPIWGGQTNDKVSGDSDKDLIHGAGGHDQLFGLAGHDQLWADKGNDIIRGGAGRDTLYGNEGHDTLNGCSSADRLIGGSGRDVLTGERGDDTFVFESVTDSNVGTPDKITDFEHRIDVIDLSKIDADTGLDGDQSFHYIGSESLGAAAGELRLNSNGMLMGDVDGDGESDFAIKIEGYDTSLTSRDFIL